MKHVSHFVLASVIATLSCGGVYAQEKASDVDKAFVAKVSQGGEFEVEASQIAVEKAMAQDVKDLAIAEVHDHKLVGQELKAISKSKQVAIAPALNGEFIQKLSALRGLSGSDFDSAYLSEMIAIHDKDEKLFAQEAMDGGASAYRAFAAKTDPIVKRHIGALHGTDAK